MESLLRKSDAVEVGPSPTGGQPSAVLLKDGPTRGLRCMLNCADDRAKLHVVRPCAYM